jgi:hypothetical protein
VRKAVKIINILGMCLVSTSLIASAGAGDGRISNYLVSSNGMFFFQTENMPDRIGCNTENAFAISMTGPNASAGKAIIATVIAAEAQGKTVRVIGKGSCDLWGDRETVDYITVYRSQN